MGLDNYFGMCWDLPVIISLPRDQNANSPQLISMELNRWYEGKEKGKPASLPYPQVIAFLLEKFNIKSTEEADNVKCLLMGSMNLGKMGIKYDKPAKPLGLALRLGVPRIQLFPLRLEQGTKKWILTLVLAVLQEYLPLKRRLLRS